MEEKDLIFKLADYVINTNFEDLPEEVVDRTKILIVDTLGVVLPGYTAPGVQDVEELMSNLTGKADSTVFVSGRKFNAIDTAMVNSMRAHALDLDDLHEGCIVHPSNCQVPVALAVAEQVGGVTGKELITAVALGIDLSCRLAYGIIDGIGFIRSGICGIFGAVATAAKLRKCTREELLDAFGIALSQTAGNAQVLPDGALVKRMQPGLMARDGILSVLLAEIGITGTVNTLQGRYGFLELYKRGKVTPERIVENLGQAYEVMNVSVKPYPGGRFIHGPAELGIKFAEEDGLTPEQVSEIKVYLSKTAYDYVANPYNADHPNPQVMAQFCAIYAAAAGIVRKDLFIGEMTDEVITSPEIAELAEKIELVVDESITDPTATTPVGMKVRTKDGRVLKDSVEFLKGHPKNFLSRDEIVDKFRKCVALCEEKIPEENIEKIIGFLDNLEDLSDASIIPGLMTKES